MAIFTPESINVGTGPNLADGESLRSAFVKINTNFTNCAASTFTATKAVDSVKTSAYTLTANDHGNCIVAQGTVTITIPSVGTLGTGYWTEILCESGSTILDGTGSTDITLLVGEIAIIRVINSKVRISKGLSTDVTT